MTDFKSLQELAIRIATEAGQLLLKRPSSFELDEKSGALDFATQMDHASEELIISSIRKARPDDGILGEEGGAVSGTSGITWVIDPIDGTVNYLYGIPSWCVSIAIKDSQGPIVGVVTAPAIGLTWSAARGEGATCNGSVIRCNDPISLDKALIATGFSYDRERRKRQADFVAALLPRVRDIRRMGACAVDIAMVASGMVDAHFESGVNEWDHAAAALIAQEAGALVTVREGIWHGEKNFVLVAGPALHADLSQELGSYLGQPLG
jgi:myo-inositol-1(or 4)-monophosphatase